MHERPDFSHCRALAMAFETLRHPAAARPLARLLGRPGMSGHAVTQVLVKDSAGRASLRRGNRNPCLRELVLARALYRCGDREELGRKILEEYTKDLRGHLSRHANAVLEGPE